MRRRYLDISIDDVLDRLLPDALAQERFEILSRVDLEPGLHPKLGLTIRRHTIFGVCNPHLSDTPTQSPESLGLLLQCNIVVYEDEGRTVIGMVRPTAAADAVRGEGLGQIAAALEKRLERVLERVAGGGGGRRVTVDNR